LNQIKSFIFFGELPITSEHCVVCCLAHCTAIMSTMLTALKSSVRGLSHICIMKKLRRPVQSLISRSQLSCHHRHPSLSPRQHGSLMRLLGVSIVNAATLPSLKTPQDMVTRAQRLTVHHSQGIFAVCHVQVCRSRVH